MIGVVALTHGQRELECEVIKSRKGYFIGTTDEDGFSFSRESVEYYATADLAHDALDRGDWTQRFKP